MVSGLMGYRDVACGRGTSYRLMRIGPSPLGGQDLCNKVGTVPLSFSTWVASAVCRTN